MVDYGHWSVDIVGEFDPAEFFGFIYEIEEVDTSRKYIGRRQIKVKGKTDWRKYTGSCKELNEIIKQNGKEKFIFRILILCSGKCQLTYEEESTQYSLNVLRARLPNGERKYFNKTIGYRNFAALEKQSEETKRKMSESHKGLQNAKGKNLGDNNPARRPEVREKISLANKGKGTKDKTPINRDILDQTNPMFDKKHKEESIRKMSEVKKERNQGQRARFIKANPLCRVLTDGIKNFPSVRDAARQLDVHRRVIHRMIENGELRYV